MKYLFLVFLLALASICNGQTKTSVVPVKVKIEATELDRKMILEKLNVHGQGHHLTFALAEERFDYRILFSTDQKTVNGINSSFSSTSVFDPDGSELFEFKREGRWTDAGSANAAAKEIIKRLLELKKKK